MKSIILMALSVIVSVTMAQAQIKNAKTKTVKVNGNCGMCKSTIEKTANKKNISKASWNEETKMASITYDSKKTTLNAVLKNIADAGYDNEQFTAPDDVYNKLHGCCQYDRETKPSTDIKHENHEGHQHSGMQMHSEVATDPIPATKQTANQLATVFENYFSIKNALVKTDAATAAASAKTLLIAMAVVQMKNLNATEHTAWMKVMDALRTNSEGIAANANAATQRKFFMALSSDMYDVIKASKTEAPVYYQHCPMANGGKGANWLSKENAVKNPYYGSMMLSCGRTIETIQ